MKRIGIVLWLLAPIAAHASNCSWDVVPANINFGSYSAFSPNPVTATSAFGFTCTPNTTVTLTLSRGSSPTYNPRTMTTAGGTLNYNLFMDASNTIVWGDGTAGTQFLTFVSSPGTRSDSGTIYATIPAGLNAASGSYTDTVQATLNYGSGTLTQFITITVTVSAACSVSTASLNFGAYDPVVTNAATPLDATGTVNVYCTAGTPVTVLLDLGQHASGTTRRMLSGAANFLSYEVYKDAG